MLLYVHLTHAFDHDCYSEKTRLAEHGVNVQEHFLKRITDAAYTRARMDKRGKSVLYKDLGGWYRLFSWCIEKIN